MGIIDLLAIRTELGDVLTKTGLAVYEVPKALTAPAILMGDPLISYDSTMGDDINGTVDWQLEAIVSRSHPDTLSILAEVLGTTGDRSIPKTVMNNQPQECGASFWYVTNSGPWSDLDVGTVSYWTAEISVKIEIL